MRSQEQLLVARGSLSRPAQGRQGHRKPASRTGIEAAPAKPSLDGAGSLNPEQNTVARAAREAQREVGAQRPDPRGRNRAEPGVGECKSHQRDTRDARAAGVRQAARAVQQIEVQAAEDLEEGRAAARRHAAADEREWVRQVKRGGAGEAGGGIRNSTGEANGKDSGRRLGGPRAPGTRQQAAIQQGESGRFDVAQFTAVQAERLGHAEGCAQHPPV